MLARCTHIFICHLCDHTHFLTHTHTHTHTYTHVHTHTHLPSHVQSMMGKDFGGDAFNTTPAVVEFKDFEVGHTYTSKVIITNRSYAKNTFRVLEVRIMSSFVVYML